MKTLMMALPGAMLFGLFLAPASAQVKSEATPVQKFVMQCANADYAEVQLGELAQKNAASQQVKDFGKMMVDEHNQARKNLLNQFKDLKIGVLSTMDKADKQLYDQLSKLKGADFDRDYMKAQVDRHQQAAKFLEGNLKNDDNNVSIWSQRELKTVQDHLKRAENIQKNLK